MSTSTPTSTLPRPRAYHPSLAAPWMKSIAAPVNSFGPPQILMALPPPPDLFRLHRRPDLGDLTSLCTELPFPCVLSVYRSSNVVMTIFLWSFAVSQRQWKIYKVARDIRNTTEEKN